MIAGKSTPTAALNRVVLQQQAAADAWADAASAALGVNRTDFACLRALYVEGPCPAGRLAELTGLTTGTVTGVADRLEKASFVHRRADPDDRRRVILEVSGDRAAALAAIFERVAAGQPEAAVERFLEGQTALFQSETARLRAATAGTTIPTQSGDVVIPLRDVRTARFEVAGGAMDLEIVALPLASDLLRAELSGPPLRISEQDGHVRVAHRALSLRRPSGAIQLNAEPAWSVRVGGGRNHLSFDLRQATVQEVEVDGGDGRLTFAFGAFDGLVPFRVNGGASEFIIDHPAGVDVEVVARGRISKLVADGRDLGALTAATWRTGTSARGRVRIHVRGGLNKVSVASARV